MRVTQSALTRNFMRSLNKNISNLAKSNERLTTQRAFNRVSDNTADAARAFTLREQLYKNEQSLTNIRDAQGELSSTESNMQSVNKILISVKESLTKGINGPLSESDREVYARSIRNMQEQLLQIGNVKYADKQLFGGSNNETAPFSKDATGKLLFNGIDVNSIVKNTTTGILEYPATPPATGMIPVPENKEVYIDIGMGLIMSGSGVDKRSAVKVSTSGLEAFGFGTTTKNGETMPNNLISLLGKIADDFSSGNSNALNENLDHLTSMHNDMLMNITDIGNRANFMDQSVERLENDIINLQTTQKKVEGVSMEQESMLNKTYEAAWMITLQLGSKILPPSIFDFMR